MCCASSFRKDTWSQGRALVKQTDDKNRSIQEREPGAHRQTALSTHFYYWPAQDKRDTHLRRGARAGRGPRGAGRTRRPPRGRPFGCGRWRRRRPRTGPPARAKEGKEGYERAFARGLVGTGVCARARTATAPCAERITGLL